MKKAIVLSVIGLAAGLGATTALGQGQAIFSAYSDSVPITGDVSSGTVSSFTVTMLYSLSAVTQAAGNDLPSGSLLQAYQMPDAANSAYGMLISQSPNVFWYGSGGSTTGMYFKGVGNSADFQLQSYTSGSVWLEVLAYNGADYASSSIRGHSAVWSQSLAVAPSAPSDILMPTFAVTAVVPEPTTMALGGLGMAALMLFRRKKV